MYRTPRKVQRWVRQNQLRHVDNVSFIQWDDKRQGCDARITYLCTVTKCELSSMLVDVMHGCQCASCRVRNNQNIPAIRQRIEKQISELPFISFVRWCCGDPRVPRTKVVVRCEIDGHEWCESLSSLYNNGAYCEICGAYTHDSDDSDNGIAIIRSDGIVPNYDILK